ncbi:MAG: glycosyltransferase family 4 protein [candidate division Zixibacteria bacterium]|nr:glycosyltransferase family 4 protein [candidate division Zixibacteria bacterium]
MKLIFSATLDGRNAGTWYAVNTASRLQARGHEILFIPRPHGQTIAMAREAGLRVIDDLDLEQKSPSRMYRNLRRLLTINREFQPDAVLAHWGEDHSLWGIAKSMSRRKPVLIRVRSLDPKLPSRHPLSRWLHRRATDMIVTSNERLASAYRTRHKIPAEKLKIIPAGIEPNAWDGKPAGPKHLTDLAVPTDCPIVVLLARYSPVKGHRVLLSAIPHIRRRHPNVHFLWLGYSSEYEAGMFRRWFVEGNLTKQITIVDTMIPDLFAVLSQCTIGVVTSIGSESVSRSLLEYMQSGIPVVATDVGGIPDLMREGEFGLLVPPDNAKALADGISDLLDSADSSREMGRRAREYVLNHATWDQRVDDWEALLVSTISGAQRKSTPSTNRPSPKPTPLGVG